MTAFENPYRPHKYNRRQFCKKDCCGVMPQRSGMELYCHSVATGDSGMAAFVSMPYVRAVLAAVSGCVFRNRQSLAVGASTRPFRFIGRIRQTKRRADG